MGSAVAVTVSAGAGTGVDVGAELHARTRSTGRQSKRVVFQDMNVDSLSLADGSPKDLPQRDAKPQSILSGKIRDSVSIAPDIYSIVSAMRPLSASSTYSRGTR